MIATLLVVLPLKCAYIEMRIACLESMFVDDSQAL